MSDTRTLVRLPRLLDAQLRTVRPLHPKPLSMTEKLTGVSEATMRLAPDEEAPQLRSFVRLYTAMGDAGVWRVSSVNRSPVTGETAVTLLHGRDVLSDAVMLEQSDFTGTAEQLLAKVMQYQTAFVGGTPCWTLGTVANVQLEKRSINFDRCSDVLASIESELTDYCFTYDMSGFPWVLSLAPKSGAVTTEWRMARNIERVSITMNDADLCTRLIVSAHHEATTAQQGGAGDDVNSSKYASTGGTSDVMRIFTYQSQSAINRWGVVVKTADIDVADDLAAGTQPGVIEVDGTASSGYPGVDAWARAFMALRRKPGLQIQLTGRELCRRSGCQLDQVRLGMLSRVNLARYGEWWEERVVTIQRPDVLGDPESVNVSMASTLPRFSESIARIRQQTEANAASSRSSRRSRSVTEKEITHWEQIVKRTWDAVDGTGLRELKETGIVLDTETGAKIYSLIQGENSLYGQITVNAGKVAAEVARATQAEGTLQANIDAQADQIKAMVTQTKLTETLSGYLTITANKTQLGNLLDQDGKVTAATIATEINNQTGTGIIRLHADKIDLDGVVTTSTLYGKLAYLDNIFAETQKVTGVWSDQLHTAGLYVSDQQQGSAAASGWTKYSPKTMDLFGITATSGTVLGHGDGMTWRHYHEIEAAEDTANPGKIKITLKEAVPTSDTSKHIANFNIADTQFYKDAVSAAEQSAKLSSWGSAVLSKSYADGKITLSHRVTAYHKDGEGDNVAFLTETGQSNPNDFSLVFDDKAGSGLAFDAGRNSVTLTGGWKDGTYKVTTSGKSTESEMSTELDSVSRNGAWQKGADGSLKQPVKVTTTDSPAITVLSDVVTIGAVTHDFTPTSNSNTNEFSGSLSTTIANTEFLSSSITPGYLRNTVAGGNVTNALIVTSALRQKDSDAASSNLTYAKAQTTVNLEKVNTAAAALSGTNTSSIGTAKVNANVGSTTHAYSTHTIAVDGGADIGTVKGSSEVTFSLDGTVVARKLVKATYGGDESGSVTLAALSVSNNTSDGKPITYNTTDNRIEFYPQYRLSTQSSAVYWDKIHFPWYTDIGMEYSGGDTAYGTVTASAKAGTDSTPTTVADTESIYIHPALVKGDAIYPASGNTTYYDYYLINYVRQTSAASSSGTNIRNLATSQFIVSSTATGVANSANANIYAVSKAFIGGAVGSGTQYSNRLFTIGTLSASAEKVTASGSSDPTTSFNVIAQAKASSTVTAVASKSLSLSGSDIGSFTAANADQSTVVQVLDGSTVIAQKTVKAKYTGSTDPGISTSDWQVWDENGDGIADTTATPQWVQNGALLKAYIRIGCKINNTVYTDIVPITFPAYEAYRAGVYDATGQGDAPNTDDSGSGGNATGTATHTYPATSEKTVSANASEDGFAFALPSGTPVKLTIPKGCVTFTAEQSTNLTAKIIVSSKANTSLSGAVTYQLGTLTSKLANSVTNNADWTCTDTGVLAGTNGYVFIRAKLNSSASDSWSIKISKVIYTYKAS